MFAGVCKKLVSGTQDVTFDDFVLMVCGSGKIDTFGPKITQTILP